jgi:hypothetical protein
MSYPVYTDVLLGIFGGHNPRESEHTALVCPVSVMADVEAVVARR